MPLVTPVGPDGAVSGPCVRAMIDSVRSEAAALMPAISCGEGWLLSEQQWSDMLRFTLRFADGLPCLVGAQVPTAAGAIARAAVAAELGADAVVVSAPSGRPAPLPQEEIFEHFATVAAASALPVFVYNESAVCGQRIEQETLRRILRIDRVSGMKESSRSPRTTRALAGRPRARRCSRAGRTCCWRRRRPRAWSHRWRTWTRRCARRCCATRPPRASRRSRRPAGGTGSSRTTMWRG
ncbi:hypothetical protein GXW82_10185 [Streptacidiphilus sp. 4-A2]|nr:hypothetical protein [Streptacidiphilus sp. 4-A2]